MLIKHPATVPAPVKVKVKAALVDLVVTFDGVDPVEVAELNDTKARVPE